MKATRRNLFVLRFHGAFFAIVCGMLAAAQAQAQIIAPLPRADTPSVSPNLSFEAADALLDASSAVRQAANAELKAAEEQAGAVATLNRPTIAIDAQLLHYQKTFDISLAGVFDQAESVAGQLLPGIVDNLPGVAGDVLETIHTRLQQALPEIFSALPDSVRLRTSDTTFRPVANAVMPLYTGGAIPAIQDAAGAGVTMARAKRDAAGDLETVNLVRLYFGQELARQALEIARETRDGFDNHLANARAMEREGFLSTGQRLQVEVARDAAQRQFDRAELEYDTAVRSLASLLNTSGAVATTTPLFVNSAPIESRQHFVDLALVDHPRLAEVAGGREIAHAGVDLARSRLRPSAFAFGAYNLNRSEALPTEPDWVVGVGVRYTILSSFDRNRMLGAARARSVAANQIERRAREEIEQLVTRSYNLVELSRRQFLSLDSSLAAATESLRVQEISFREGEVPVSTLIDARNLLGVARLQRSAAAYEYDLALAALLAASGQGKAFLGHIGRADRVIAQ